MPAEVVITFDIFPELGAILENRTRRIVQKTCRAIKADAKRSIFQGPKSGRVYTSGPQPLPHQASAAGEAPANWTGALADSIHYRTWATGPGTAEGEVTVGEAHGFFLEHGTIKMEARPFMGPAADKVEPIFVAAMNALTTQAMEEYLAALDAEAGDEAAEEVE